MSCDEEHEVLKRVIQSVCLIYYVLFLELAKAMKQSRKDLFEEVQSVIWDPEFNTRQIGEQSNLVHYQLFLWDI